MPRTHSLLIPLVFFALIVQCAQAQSHFSSCLDGAGNIFNATVIVLVESTPEVNGTPLTAGSEIAVYTSDAQYPHLCVGMLVWQANHGFLAVWGDDDLTPERDGLLAGELLRYRVWDSAAGVEYGSESVQVSYAQGDGHYSDDAVMVVGALRVAQDGLDVAVEAGSEVPEEVQLYANYPNPFNDATTIAFGLPRKTHVTMEVYDLLGKRVATLLSEMFPAGRHEVRWKVRDVPSGVYLCRMQADGIVLRREFIVVK